jgi:hypothetical protein
MKPLDWVRLLTAYGSAAVVVALLAGILTMSPLAVFFVMVAVLAFELVVLLPIYLLLHWRGLVTRGVVLVLGVLIGAGPWAWFAWPLRHPELKTTASSGGVQTMIDGVPTLAGWMEYGVVTALFGFIGLAAAAGFWVVLGKHEPKSAGAADPQAPSPIDARPRRWQSVAVAAAIAVIAILPMTTKDRSCHNVFRDVPTYSLGFGGHSARPKVVLYFPARTQDWNDISRALVAHGKAHDLQVLDMTEQDESSKQLYVSLCNEGGTVISILDRVYSFGPPQEARDEQSIAVFGMRPDSDWERQAASLEGVMRAKYGEKVRREDRR